MIIPPAMPKIPEMNDVISVTPARIDTVSSETTISVSDQSSSSTSPIRPGTRSTYCAPADDKTHSNSTRLGPHQVPSSLGLQSLLAHDLRELLDLLRDQRV